MAEFEDIFKALTGYEHPHHWQWELAASVPSRWATLPNGVGPTEHRDFGIHAATVELGEDGGRGQQAGRLKTFLRILRAGGPAEKFFTDSTA